MQIRILIKVLSTVKNSTLAQIRLLDLHYICWASPDEHLAVSSMEFHQKITEIYGSKVDQSLSAILSHMVAGNFRVFFKII